MNTSMTKTHILSGALDKTLAYIYGEAALTYQKQRYASAIDEFVKIW